MSKCDGSNSLGQTIPYSVLLLLFLHTFSCVPKGLPTLIRHPCLSVKMFEEHSKILEYHLSSRFLKKHLPIETAFTCNMLVTK